MKSITQRGLRGLRFLRLILAAALMGPPAWLYWRLGPEEAEDFFAMGLARTLLSENKAKIDRSMEDFSSAFASAGMEVQGAHLTSPPEGELVQPSRALLLLFWCSPALRRGVLEKTTLIYRHRVKHYTLGNLSRLVPEEA